MKHERCSVVNVDNNADQCLMKSKEIHLMKALITHFHTHTDTNLEASEVTIF